LRVITVTVHVDSFYYSLPKFFLSVFIIFFLVQSLSGILHFDLMKSFSVSWFSSPGFLNHEYLWRFLDAHESYILLVFLLLFCLATIHCLIFDPGC
jgi:hypothetical protein